MSDKNEVKPGVVEPPRKKSNRPDKTRVEFNSGMAKRPGRSKKR